MNDFAPAYHAVLHAIEQALLSAGRPAKSAHLLAVSKKHPASSIESVYALGQRDFGENYPQELAEKVGQLRHLNGIRWHAIGPIQSNKAKLIAENADVVHSLSRSKIAMELNRFRADSGKAPLDVLLQLSLAGEAQKSGLDLAELNELLACIAELPHLRLKGLMTMPPFGDLKIAEECFTQLRTLQEKYGSSILPELSMGMSADMELAINCGATWLRIGTAIFGERIISQEIQR